MIRRVERPGQPLRKLGLAKRASSFVPLEERRDPELALAYSNGFVTVEISHDALDRYVQEFGDVPLPVRKDKETGDKCVFDAKNNVRVIYDREAHVREVNTRSREGLHVRINFPNAKAS